MTRIELNSCSLPLHHDWSVQLVNQTQEMLAYAQPTLSRIVDASKTLVAFWIGINDIGDSSGLHVDFPTYYNELISTMFDQSVTPIYKAGYKNFLFINLPPLDRAPYNLVKPALNPNTTMINWWDEILEQHREAFHDANKDTNTLLFDANSFLNSILDNAGNYGFKNITSFCPAYNQPLPVEQYGCLPLDEYFWYDSGHM